MSQTLKRNDSKQTKNENARHFLKQGGVLRVGNFFRKVCFGYVPEYFFRKHFFTKYRVVSSKNFMFAIYVARHGGRATADYLYHTWGFNAAFDPCWGPRLAYEFTSLQTHLVYFFVNTQNIL